MFSLTVNKPPKRKLTFDFEPLEDFVMPDLEHDLREIKIQETHVRLLCYQFPDTKKEMWSYHLRKNGKAKRRYKWFRHSMKLFKLWFVSKDLKKHEYVEYTRALMLYNMYLTESIFWLKYELSKFAPESAQGLSVVSEYCIREKQITTEYHEYRDDSKNEDDTESYKSYHYDSDKEEAFDSCNIEVN
jgi:hypothetical protein